MLSRIRSNANICALTKSSVISQPLLQNRHLHVSHRLKHINSRIACLGRYSPHSTNVNTKFIRFSSTTQSTSENITENTTPTQDAIPQIPDPPTIVNQEIVDAGHVTLESLGLGGYLPIGLVQNALYWVHTSIGLPWWATIFVGVTCAKILILPVFIRMQRHQALVAVHRKEINYFEEKKKEATENLNQMKVQIYTTKQEAFYASNKMMTTKQTLLAYTLQGSIFFTFFMALRGILSAPIESLKTNGFFWISDLSQPDPYYLLPLLCGASTAIMALYFPPAGVDLKLAGMKMRWRLVIPAISVPFLIFFKSGLLIYILSSTWLTITLNILMKIPKIRSLCRIAPTVKVDEQEFVKQKSSSGPMEGVIKAYQSFKYNRAYKNFMSMDDHKFNSAGRNAITKTYKYDPTKRGVALKKEMNPQ